MSLLMALLSSASGAPGGGTGGGDPLLAAYSGHWYATDPTPTVTLAATAALDTLAVPGGTLVQAPNGGGLRRSGYLVAGTTQGVQVRGNCGRLETTHTGTKVVFHVAGSSTTGLVLDYRVWVDGKVAGAPVITQPIDGSGYLITVSFPTAATRRVALSASMWAAVRWVSHDGTITAPTGTRRRLHLVGDSWIQAVFTPADYPGYSPALDGPGQIIQAALGIDTWDVGSDGVSGSAYASYDSAGRRAFVQVTQPHVVMVWGSVNQDGTTGASMTTYAQTYYADLKVDAPTAKVVVIGHQAAWNAAGNAETAASQAVLDVATTNAAGNIDRVVNQRALAWFTSAMYAAGSGSTGWYVPSGASGQGHPTPAGTWYLADKIRAELGPVLATIP